MHITFISSATNLLRRDKGKAEHSFRTREETVDVIKGFIPPPIPITIKEPNVRQAGGWYYFLWENEDRKVIYRSSRPNLWRNKYYVTQWRLDENPSLQDIEDAIQLDATGVYQANMDHGVTIKTGFFKNADGNNSNVHVWSSQDMTAVYDQRKDNSSLFVSYLLTGKHRRNPSKALGWMQSKWKGFSIPLPKSDNPESTVERLVTETSYRLINEKLEKDTIPIEIQGHPVHLKIVRLRKAGAYLLRRYKMKSARTGEAADAIWELAGVVQGGFSVIGTSKSAVGIAYDLIRWVRNEAVINYNYPGKPDRSNERIKSITGDPRYIYPLGDFFLPGKPGLLKEGNWVQEPNFGFLGLAPISRQAAERPIDLELLKLLYPTRGSQIRLYDYVDLEQTKHNLRKTGAIRIYHPHGIAVTIERDRVYFHFETDRHLDKEKHPSISNELRERLRQLENRGVLVTSNVLEGHKGLNEMSVQELNEEFRKKYGTNFIRLKSKPTLPAAAMAVVRDAAVNSLT